MANLCKFTFILLFLVSTLAVAQTPPPEKSSSTDDMPKPKFFGATSIVSNYIVNGLTQSDKLPAIQASVGAKIGNFRAGVFGTSVKFPTDNDLIRLEIFGEYQFIMTSNLNLTARYGITRYSPDGIRSGAVKMADFSVFNYHFIYSAIENWEGTGYDQTHFGAYHEHKIETSFAALFGGGYNTTDAEGYANYFDFKLGGLFLYQEFKAELSATLTSHVFGTNSRAGPYLYLGAHVEFK